MAEQTHRDWSFTRPRNSGTSCVLRVCMEHADATCTKLSAHALRTPHTPSSVSAANFDSCRQHDTYIQYRKNHKKIKESHSRSLRRTVWANVHILFHRQKACSDVSHVHKCTASRSCQYSPPGPQFTFPSAEHHRPLIRTKLYCLLIEAHEWEQLAQVATR